MVTASETEALLLEDNFIKEARPPFNLRLRDDKSYPYIEITLSDEWPRVRFFRGRHVPGNLYFGPYSSARKVRETLELIGRIFPYRKCKGAEPGRPSGSPCLQYFIKRSLGPCDDRCSREEYLEVDRPGDRLPARPAREVERGIEREMAAAAAAQEFEKAALLRDRLAAVRHVHERQAARIEGAGPFDVIGLTQGDPGANVQVFLRARRRPRRPPAFYVENAAGREPATVLEEFLLEFYWDGAVIPPEVVAPLEDGPGWRAVLGERRGSKVAVRARPARPQAPPAGAGPAQRRAGRADRARRASRARASSRIEALERLRDALGLEPPAAAHRVLRHLQPRRAAPRRLHGGVRGRRAQEGALPQVRACATSTGQDDFAMMNQVLRPPLRAPRRRRRRRRGYDESFAALPDLVVVDGGKGQLSAAARGAARQPAPSVASSSLAKQREEVFVPGRRDAAAAAGRRPGLAAAAARPRRGAPLRRDATTGSGATPTCGASPVFDELPQVGPVRRRRILEHFGSPERFLAASREEIERVPGLPPQGGEGDLCAPP